MNQNYSAYTPEDQVVWKTLYQRQMKHLPEVASHAYLKGIKTVGFEQDRIPEFKQINEKLGKTTGWSLHVVPNIIPEKEFFPLLASKKFSATTWLRKLEELDYLEEPDMFHDVFGHVPLLSNPVFCDFFHGLSLIAMKHAHSEKALKLLGRMYWFTIEFGLINEKGKTRIYGAGILSSHAETIYSLSEKPRHLPFDVREMLSTSYRNDCIQEKYFVIESYEQLFGSLQEIEQVLKEMI